MSIPWLRIAHWIGLTDLSDEEVERWYCLQRIVEGPSLLPLTGAPGMADFSVPDAVTITVVRDLGWTPTVKYW
jgi:hypothetical protein